MKKQLGLILGTATVCATATYSLVNFIHKALIRREFSLPDWFTKSVTENDSSAMGMKSEECKKWLEEYGYERVELISDDGLKLRGYLVKPAKESDVYVFGAHGYRSDGKGEWGFYTRHYVEELGFNMFFVDHRASGESEGEYIGFDYFEHNDCLKWLGYLNDRFGDKIQIILHGISMGSATVMMMSGSEKLPANVKFTVSDCGYTSAQDEFTYKLNSLNVPHGALISAVNKLNKTRVGYDFGKDTSAIEAVKKAKLPILFVHGGDDKFVPTSMVYELYEAYQGEYKDILVVEGAQHAESYLLGKEAYEKKIDEFIDRYIVK